MLKRLFQEHLVHYKKQFGLAFVLMLTSALSTAALPYLLKPVFDDVFHAGTPLIMVLFCGAVFLTFVIKGFSSYGESITMNTIGQSIIADLEKRLFTHIIRSDLAFFHHYSTGDLLSRFTNDIQLMRGAVSNAIVGLGRDFLTLLLLIALMFHRDFYLALFSFILFPAAFGPIAKIGRKIRKITHQAQDGWSSLMDRLTQVFHGIRIVKAYGCEGIEEKTVHATIDLITDLSLKTVKTRSLTHPIIESLAGFVIAGIIAYGGYQVSHGYKTTGDFISFIGALIIAYEPLKRLSHLNANLQEGLSAAKRFFDLLDLKPIVEQKINPDTNYVPLLNAIDFNHPTILSFKDVLFSYDDQKMVLNHVSFDIKKGSRIAFVGPSGSGKSTLINLIPHFYNLNFGSIELFGTNITTMDRRLLRSQLSLVSQEVILFNQSVKDNILYGAPVNTTYDDVVKACKDANAHEFIEKLPLGYESIIGENGSMLSGGQRQRLSIARALIRKSPLILFDEATSSLDNQSERQIHDILMNNIQDKTLIMVAHRLSTVVDADYIYVMDDGKIIQWGTHGELLNQQGGLYAHLWGSQL
jgi:subfamily B ATP-binding cassette protein MsbA